MKISVVLPVYNRRLLMYPALVSLIYGQQRPPDEILVVDDGSTDNLGAMIDALKARMKRNRVQVALRYLRLNRASAYRNSSYPYNVGIRAADGDVVVYCAGELVHFPRNIQVVEESLGEDDFLIGGSIFFEGEQVRVDTERLDRIWNHPFDVYHKDYYGRDDRILLMWDSISGVHAVYRRHLLEVQGFEESLSSWGHNDGHMRRRMLDLKGLREVRRPQIITIHQWHPRPPAENMANATANYNTALASGLVANVGRPWGDIHAPPD